jgi:hypothetical protein
MCFNNWIDGNSIGHDLDGLILVGRPRIIYHASHEIERVGIEFGLFMNRNMTIRSSGRGQKL